MITAITIIMTEMTTPRRAALRPLVSSAAAREAAEGVAAQAERPHCFSRAVRQLLRERAPPPDDVRGSRGSNPGERTGSAAGAAATGSQRRHRRFRRH